MKSSIANEEIKLMKGIVKQSACCEDIREYLTEKFEQITNLDCNNLEYEERYNLIKLAHSKRVKALSKKYKGDSKEDVIIDFIIFENAKQGYVIVYNKFENNDQTEMDVFI